MIVGVEPYVDSAAAIILLVIVGLLHYRIDRKVSRTDKTATSIDHAVNSRPSSQPKLYDMAQSTGAALEVIRGEMNSGLARIDHRLDGMDARINVLDSRADSNFKRLGKLEERVPPKSS